MKIIDLYAGNYSFGRVALARGHEVIGVDVLPCPDDLQDTVMHYQQDALDMVLPKADFIAASPPCTTFSVGGFPAGHRKEGIAVSDIAKEHDLLVKYAIIAIMDCGAGYIENPRGLLRKQPYMREIPFERVTVAYCQYGDTRMKPTDLWFYPAVPEGFDVRMCKNGAPCHERAPRGSKTGTQGRKKEARSHMPPHLCAEILEALEAF